MRLNPIAAYRDFSKKKELKLQLIAQVKKLPPGGTGIDIQRFDPLTAAAVMELVREQGHWLVITKWRDTFMLCRKSSMEGMPGNLQQAFKSAEAFVTPDEDLLP